jgi:glutamine---fructose-6-phosphate transaminase (isomerizing)
MMDRVEQLREDTAGGPSALAAVIEGYGAEGGPLAGIGDRPTGIAFSGLGSSRYAALTAASEARRLGIAAWPELASSAAPTPPSPGQVLVAISASGRTRETIESARRYRAGGGRVIAMTNEPASGLTAEADHVLPLLAGAEGAGIATRTFRGTLAVCAMLIRRWADPGCAVESLLPTVARLRAVMDGADAWLPAAVELFEGRMAIDVLGDDADAALVHQAALMLREAPRQPAVPHDTADWLHTAVYLALPGHRALLFSGSDLDGEVVDTIRRRGGETVVIGSSVDGAALTIELPQSEGPFERAIVASIVAELLAAELWRRTTAEDVEAR